MAQAAPRRHGAVLGACATTILLPRRRPPGSLGARPRSWDGPEALELVQFSGFLRKKSGRSLRGTCACRVIRAVVHPMVERDPCDSTVRSNQGGLRSRENIERGIMWLAPRQWFLPFESKRVVLGRGEDCTHVLPGAEVSRYHAELVPEGGIVWLRDLRSTNGCHHNGRRVPQAILAKQDVVRLGEWVGVVCSIPRGTAATVECIGGLYAGAELRDLLRYAEQVAPSDIPLILQGETGTGKEVLARFIHDQSGRPGNFVAVNCAALPESLAEAELFGHSRGAYTGAEKARPGYIRAADHGTLLLDEISDLPLAIQAKLLRVLEDSQVTPLGESLPVRVHIRVIAAGQKPLSELVSAGKFRGDLFARLNGLELRLPALRERREEIPFIFGAVLREARPGYAPLLQPRLVERLCVYHWPYNVRELVQLTRRIAALYPDHAALVEGCLPAHMLPPTDESEPPHARPHPPVATTPYPVPRPGVREATPAGFGTPGEAPRGYVRPVAVDPPMYPERSTVPSPHGPEAGQFERLGQAFREQELEALRAALREHGGNVSDAARALGVSRQKVYRLIEADPTLDLDNYRRRP